MRVRAARVLMLWVALELNIVRVLPLLRFERGPYGGEVRIKYFLVQAWGSALFLAGFLFGQFRRIGAPLVVLALLIKLGAAPLHLWFIRVLRLRRLETLVLLSTVQKVIPLLLLQHIGGRGSLVVASAMGSALVAGWGAFNHSGLRVVLAYSSIFSVAWCLRAFLGASWLWLTYLGVYAVRLVVFVRACATKNLTRLTQLYLFSGVVRGALFVFFSMASIGGLPPMASFWVKLAVLDSLTSRGNFGLAALLLGGSVWILYLYIRVAYFSRTQGNSAVLSSALGHDRLAPQLGVILGLPVFLLVGLVLLRGVITWSFDLQDLREA